MTKAYEAATVERAEIIQVIRNALRDLPTDRLGLDRDIDEQDPLPKFLSYTFRVLAEELRKAWDVCQSVSFGSSVDCI